MRYALFQMYMFRAILETVPKTRSQMVNELDIPEEITVAPYICSEPDESLECNSITSVSLDEFEVKTASSDSSLALSRAMTDSEIDYDRYRKLKNRRLSDLWIPIRIANEAFPPGYLESTAGFQETSSDSLEVLSFERRNYNEELKQKMERFFEEECRLFTPDDPGLKVLEEVLEDIDLKSSDLDSDIS